MEYWLPVFFMAIMGMSLLVYVILDGYDLGIGLLLPFARDDEKDLMIAAIGPFWDANETWIVLGVGMLLVAFPKAHGIVLTALYLPVTFMLMGLILRGVAFDFRVKAGMEKQAMWNRLFAVGSLVAAMSQGWMLGAYVTGLRDDGTGLAFSLLIAFALPALYVMLGAAWLLIKADGELQHKAIRWARLALLPMGLGLLLVSISTPLVSQDIADKWFTLPNAIGLLPIPVSCLFAYAGVYWLLRNPELVSVDRYSWLVFAALVLLCLMAGLGLAYSIFPHIVLGQLTIWDAAASVDSLLFSFVGTAFTLPLIVFYTIHIYRIFRGKANTLSYE